MTCLSAAGIEKKPSHPSVGTKDATGQLVLHVFGANTESPTVVHLSTEYGIMMCRRENGDCLFVIGDKAKNSVQEFSSYTNFLSALDDVTAGGVLTIYDRCTVPLFYDYYPVHSELYKKFRRECEKRGLKFAKNDEIVCTCKG